MRRPNPTSCLAVMVSLLALPPVTAARTIYVDGNASGANTMSGEEPVHFADAKLKAVVEATLGISNPTPTDMLALTTLDASGQGLISFGGLECATNLSDLKLNYNRLYNISGLAELTNLTRLELYRNSIGDISVLAGLTHLTHLDLGDNLISDISPLSDLSSLQTLSLGSNPVGDISALAGLTNLTHLSLYGNQITDIAVLAGLRNLMELDLHSNPVSDISALAGLTNLTVLDLSSNRISDISAIAELTNLTRLELYHSSMRDISALAGLTHLTHLDLGRNQISDISAVAGLTNLTELDLGNNQISDISAIAELTNLEVLSLGNNTIGDISAVAGLMNLTHLRLHNSRISNIAVLARLTKLTELSLNMNQITDISAVAGLANLTMLGLGNNRISDISAIAELANLTGLSLDNNQISNIAVLSRLTKLTHLYLHDNQISDISALLGLTNLTQLHLWNNPLNQDARDIYIPQIRENNPGITIYYDYSVLTISSTAGGSVSVPGEGVLAYDYGGTLAIVASADAGYHFVYWMGTAVDAGSVEDPTAANTTVRLYSDYTLKARFAMNRGVIYVDDDATGSNDGSSWADAYRYLQDALTDANNSAKPVEVRVAQGIYKPDRGVGIGPGDRGATFSLISGVTLKGGYAGLGQRDPNARDINSYETILSGDLDGDDIDVNDPADLRHGPMLYDNSRHLVMAREADSTAVLNGFRISGGCSLGTPPIVFDSPDFCGGGMVIIAASPTIVDCTFIGNSANHAGGAVLNTDGSNPTMVNCRFERNRALHGGAIFNSGSNATFVGCTFYCNLAGYGGAISGSREVMVNSCIVWGNTHNQISGGATVSYSNVEGGFTGEGNIDADPLFADPNNGDYHLKSEAGRWDPHSRSWVRDDVTSPCIDAGDMSSPIGYEPLPNGGVVNMGAYGGTAEASKSYFGEPVCETIVAGDINGDCVVNFKDLALMATHWLEDNTPVNSDSVAKEGIEYYIYTDKSVYHLGENVHILYRVANLREVSVDVGDVPNCGYGWSDLTITNGRATDIWQYLRSIPPCGWTMLHLEPYDSKEHQFAWDMVSDNGTFGVHDDDYLVGAGSYEIKGQLRLSNPHKHKRVPVSVFIEIRP